MSQAIHFTEKLSMSFWELKACGFGRFKKAIQMLIKPKHLSLITFQALKNKNVLLRKKPADPVGINFLSIYENINVIQFPSLSASLSKRGCKQRSLPAQH